MDPELGSDEHSEGGHFRAPGPETQTLTEPTPAQPEQTARTRAAKLLGETSLLDHELESQGIKLEAASELIKPGQVAQIAKQYKVWGEEFTPEIARQVVINREGDAATTEAPKMPTAAEIKQKKPFLRLISTVLSWFGLGGRFDRFLERKAREQFNDLAARATLVIDTFANVDQPKEQFIDEVQAAYESLQQRKGSVANFIEWLRWGHTDDEKFRLLPGLAHSLRPHYIDVKLEERFALSAAKPEIVEGIKQFLRDQGRDVAEPSTEILYKWTRRIAETFAGRKLERVPQKVATMLGNIYETLPQDGREFGESMYGMCEQLAALPRRSPEANYFVGSLLGKLHKPSPSSNSTRPSNDQSGSD